MGGMINFCIGWPLPNLRTGVSLVVVAVVGYHSDSARRFGSFQFFLALLTPARLSYQAL